MTLNKMKKEIKCVNKTKSGFYRNSFDRFGDDLCELLLSYLSISDKINLASMNTRIILKIAKKASVLTLAPT
jgi:hypothetical protein